LARALPAPLAGGRGSSLFFILLALGLLFLSAVNPGLMSGARSSAADALAPALDMVTQPFRKAILVMQDVSGLAELQAENARLSQENARLREWYQAALLLEAENKSLQALLNVKIEPQHSYVTARILADSGNRFVKSLLTQAGREDGVEKGQAVLSGDGLIGRIIEAGQKTSRILLLTDINSRVPVLVENTSQHAILAGDNGPYAKLVLVSTDSEITEGSRIVTSGHGGLFPQGLPVGLAVKTPEGEIAVRPYADFNRIIHVRIIDRPDDPNLRRGSLSGTDLY
jgi:rod shape-determining protein MreC